MVALENMRTVLCFFKVKVYTAVDNRLLVVDVVVEYLGKREDLGLVVDQRKHIYRTGVLKLRILVKLIEDYLTVRISAVLDNYSHSRSARFVAECGDAVDPFILNEIGNSLTEHTLVYPIGYFCNYYSVLVLFDLGFCTDHNASSSRGVRLKDTRGSVDRRSCGEIGALDVFHKLGNSTLGVIHTVDSGVDHLSEIVGRNVGSHTYGDTHRAVYKQVGDQGATRHSLMINLGGGMVTDLGGFAASTFKRGISYINIPTTLLAMVDASVGGKTGINFNGLKNEIGVFSPAESVLIDAEFLKSLDSANLLSGYAEMLKHGLISTTAHWAELLNFDMNRIDYKAPLHLRHHFLLFHRD